MAVDAALLEAFRRYERRAVLVAFARCAGVCVLIAALAIEVAMALGLRGAWMPLLSVAAAVLLSAVYGLASRPAPLGLARRVDERARLNELLVTAVGCGGSGMPAIVRTAAVGALGRESPSHVYPFEAPRHWRRWLLVATAVQVVALVMVLRPPVSRAAQPNVTTLTLPSAGASSPQTKQDHSTPRAADTPAADAAPPLATSPAAQSPLAAAAAPGASDARNPASSSGVGDERVRLAAANAGADIAAGRVPLARRALVQRYFAAIQLQRKPPR